MRPVKSGSNVTARSSAPAERPARSTGGFAARWSTAIPRVRFRVVAPPAVCTHTISGTGRTAVPPSCSTWYCYALITTGCTIEALSPSPDPQTISSSPTAPANHSVQDRSRVRRTFPRPRWHRAPGPPASAPTGGGTSPSSRNRHQQSTRLITGAGHYQHPYRSSNRLGHREIRSRCAQLAHRESASVCSSLVRRVIPFVRWYLSDTTRSPVQSRTHLAIDGPRRSCGLSTRPAMYRRRDTSAAPESCPSR